jgi:formiminotetrahydrofolate cyclodeaminase
VLSEAGVAIIGLVQAPSFRDLTLAAFADRLASSEPVPGGGSASAIAAALGASLVAMVATLTQGRPKYAEHAALAEAVVPRAQALGYELFDLADADAQAYAACAFAMKLPRESFEDKEARDRQIKATAVVAAEVPLRSVERCLDVLRLAELLAGRSNRNASSDLRVASLLVEAAADGAAANVLVNLPLVGPGEWSSATEAQVGDLMRQVVAVARQVRAVVAAGDALPPIADVDARLGA